MGIPLLTTLPASDGSTCREVKPEFFGTLSASLFTMFQIATVSLVTHDFNGLTTFQGDSWASYVARPVYMAEKGTFDRAVALFFSSYVLSVSHSPSHNAQH